MTESEVVSILEEHGWRCESDDVGDRSCTLKIDEKVVRVFPTVGKRSDHLRVTFMPSVSSDEFSVAVSDIFGEAVKYEPIIVSNELPEKLPRFSVDDVLRMSQKAISWACSQDIESGLAAYRNLPTDAKGAMPLRHLAALAIAGDTGRLEEYKKSFDKGDRLGFVPYITNGMIERALLIAQKINSYPTNPSH